MPRFCCFARLARVFSLAAAQTCALCNLSDCLAPKRPFVALAFSVCPFISPHLFSAIYALGVGFHDFIFRLFIGLSLILLLAILLTSDEKQLISWQAAWTSTLLSAASFSWQGFSHVSAYPFKLYLGGTAIVGDYSDYVRAGTYINPAEAGQLRR